MPVGTPRRGRRPGNWPIEVAQVRLAPGVIDNLDRIVAHLQRHEVDAAEARLAGIIRALDAFMANSQIGRPAGDDRSQSVIGRGAHGYVALYRYLPVLDTALVLAIRGQREGGHAQSWRRPAWELCCAFFTVGK